MFQSRDRALKYVLDVCNAGYTPAYETVKYRMNNAPLERRYAKTEIKVYKEDVLVVAIKKTTLSNPLVLILADDQTPGGCVFAGAGMQEESLFRRTALFAHLHPSLYPIQMDEALYARDVPILLSSEDTNYQPLQDAQSVHVSFIACPGIKFPSLVSGNNRLNDTDAQTFKNKIKLILRVAQENGHSEVVFGALGCGVWGCPGKHVAQLFAEVLTDHSGVLQTAHFAILGALADVFKHHLESNDRCVIANDL